MRHRKKKNKLAGRSRAHLKADVLNMTSSLILNGKIRTTSARARLVMQHAEKLFTKVLKEEDSRRRKQVAHQSLSNVKAEKKLLSEVVKSLDKKKEKGGYIKNIKVGQRMGDNAPLCQLEITD